MSRIRNGLALLLMVIATIAASRAHAKVFQQPAAAVHAVVADSLRA